MFVRKIEFSVEEFFKQLEKEHYFSMTNKSHVNPNAVIECIFLNLPLGEFFTDTEGTMFSGEDKLSAIKRYMNNEFMFVSSLVPDCHKLKYRDLPDMYRNLISDAKIMIQILPKVDNLEAIKELLKQRG